MAKASEKRSRSFLSQIYLLLTLLAIPVLGLYEGLSYLAENTHSIHTVLAAQELVKVRNEFLTHVNESSFLINKLTELFFENKKPPSFKKNIEAFIQSENFNLQYMLFNQEGEWIADNLPQSEVSREEFRNSGQKLLQTIFSNRYAESSKGFDKLRPIFGRNFYLQRRNAIQTWADLDFTRTDFTDDKYRYWFARDEHKLVIVRGSPQILHEKKGINYFVRHIDLKTFSFAHFIDNKLQTAQGIKASQAKAAMNMLIKAPEEEIVSFETYLHMIVKGSFNNVFLLSTPLPEVKFHPGKMVKLLIMFLLLMFLVFSNSKFKTFRLEDLSIFKQISLLMVFSCGLPLIILAFAATGYFNSKQGAMVREKHNLMIDAIQSFDNNVNLHYARQTRKIRNSAAEMQPVLRQNITKQPLFDNFQEHLQSVFDSFNVAKEVRNYKKNPQKILNREFFHRNSREGKKSRIRKDEMKHLKLLSNQIISSLNNEKPEEMSAEQAYIVEIFFQKPTELVVNDMLSIDGTLTRFPWGGTIAWIYSQAFNPVMQDVFDSYLLIGVNSQPLKWQYVAENLNKIMRNPHGFQAFVASNHFFFNENSDLRKFPEMNSLFMKATDYPPPEPEIIDFSGEDQIMVCLNGNQIKDAKFCLLYPLNRINQEIEKEARDMIYIVIVALALVFSMLLILYIHLLLPVNRLHMAARALENRDCDFRLPESRGDEFAEMATIFNQSMSEFEELKIANIVQSRLLPQQGLKVKGFSIFGKSLPMIELGGDYFDYFNIDQKHFAILLGDVAGHGVGASLIMAMAKAGVICSREVMLDPAALLSRMHNIILSIKNRVQRKVMTFQYVSVNRNNREINYANAGGCTPVIINPLSRTVTPVENPAPVLGGFKKSAFANKALTIEPGQAMLFYTDGMVESRNVDGTELGYQGLYQLFLQGYATDAEKYYQNILDEYRQWLQGAEVGDDMTLIILVCQD